MLLAFAGGRYLTPTKVKVEKQIVEVEKKVKDTESEKNHHKETTVVEITRPDGTKETTTKTVEDSQANRKTSEKDDTSRKETDTKETTYATQKIHVMGMAGTLIPTDLKQLAPIYGLSISKDFIGPLNIGAFGFTNHVFGLSVGISF